MGTRHTKSNIGGIVIKFVLYGRNDPQAYVAAYTAADFNGYDFTYVELDCTPVLIAFCDGREINRAYNMAEANDWVEGLATSGRISKGIIS